MKLGDLLDYKRRRDAERNQILDELTAEARELGLGMCVAFPDAMVGDHVGQAKGIALPDPRHIHVVAAAIASGAKCIVTFNLRDFPASVLGSLGIEALHPTRSSSPVSRRPPAWSALWSRDRLGPFGTRLRPSAT